MNFYFYCGVEQIKITKKNEKIYIENVEGVETRCMWKMTGTTVQRSPISIQSELFS